MNCLVHPISMPAEYLAVLNKTGSGIPYSEEQGGGIMVEIEVFHQLHCLNFLRKVIYADYYSRPENRPLEFEVGDELFFNHIGETFFLFIPPCFPHVEQADRL